MNENIAKMLYLGSSAFDLKSGENFKFILVTEWRVENVTDLGLL